MDKDLAATLIDAEQELRQINEQSDWILSEIRRRKCPRKLTELHCRLSRERKRLDFWKERFKLEQYL